MRTENILDALVNELQERQTYLRNPNLKKAGVPVQWTQEMIDEYNRCKDDPVYFALTYMKIITIDHGLVPFKMWDFQQNLLRMFFNNRFNIVKMPRQTGKSSVSIAYMLHAVLFNAEYKIALLANKLETAQELLDRLKLAYENLPKWLQQGVITWNKRSISLENGSKIKAAATSTASVRGDTFNLVFLDEFAHIPKTQQKSFFTSTYPTISSGKTSKVIIVSTPNGIGDMFYEYWLGATEKDPDAPNKNEYVPFEVHWSNVPGRDEEWKKQTIRNTSELQFQQEFECVLGDTKIEVFDTLTNSVRNLTIEELYSLM
jgi:hypothetical protein